MDIIRPHCEREKQFQQLISFRISENFQELGKRLHFHFMNNTIPATRQNRRSKGSKKKPDETEANNRF